ncbi:MAG: RNA methyltransferase [Nitriliruptoraceae bacterium]|nr:RNA methyltransferase [Nitriliruptoraceae bacterium]
MERLSSTRNPRVKALAALARARTRRETGRHLVEGPNAVREALAAGVVEEVLRTDDGPTLDQLGGAEFDRGRPDGPRVTLVDEPVLAKLSDARHPQGVLAVARSVTSALERVVGHGVLVVLDRVADPGNAGTILRTADALGAGAVVLTTGSVDVFAPKVVRAAVGSTYHLPIVVDVALPEVVAACRAVGQPVLGLDAGGEVGLERLAGPASIALVLGNEAHGLDAGSAGTLDGLVSIALHPRAESLNVAAAAAIAIHAATAGRVGSTGAPVYPPGPEPDPTSTRRTTT